MIPNISDDALKLVDTFGGEIVKVFKRINNELKQFLDQNIQKYEINQAEKYLYPKTFLFQNTKVKFDDIYFPLMLKNDEGQTTWMSGYFDNLEPLFQYTRCISIIGTAGSGKTMLMKHCFLQFIRNGNKIPIAIELRNLNNYDGDLFGYIKFILDISGVAIDDKILIRLLKNGNFAFLFDGYDEIYSNTKEKAIHDIELFIDKYSSNYFIITSRPNAGVEALPGSTNFHVCNLTERQILSFINQQLKYIEDGDKLARRIITLIQADASKVYKSYLANPLLLSMFILTFESYPELPKTKSKFYWNVFETLSLKHDSITKKGGFLHERKTKLQNEDFETILKWFSYISLFEGQYNFNYKYLSDKLLLIRDKLGLTFNVNDLIHDLTVSISILIIDGFHYSFPHKSLQEYFGAVLISQQTELIKKKIYNDKLEKFEQKNPSGSDNIWSLCYELDKVPFSNYFLIPKLNNVLSNIEGFDSNDTLVNYFEYTQYCIEMHCDGLDIYKSYCSYTDLIRLSSFFSIKPLKNYYSAKDFNDNEEYELSLISRIAFENNFIEGGVSIKLNFSRIKNKEDLFAYCKLTGLDKAVFAQIETIRKVRDKLIKEAELEAKQYASILDLV